MRLRNKKGFTLIELLAVIIILAILMTLAITAMSGYIKKARQDTFVTTAQQYANAARLSFVNGEYGAIANGECIAVQVTNIALESGSHNSPFGHGFIDSSYVIISNVVSENGEDKYTYHIQLIDEQGNGFLYTEENSLTYESVLLKKYTGASVPGALSINSTVASANNCKVAITK